MASSEKLMALEQIMSAFATVTNSLQKDGLSQADRNRLQEAELKLRAAHRDLVKKVTKERVKRIKAASKRLGTLAKQMQGSVSSLKAVAEKVKKAAATTEKVVKVLEAGLKLVA